MEILEGSPNQVLSHYVEGLSTVVVLVNCSAVILDSVPEIHAEYKSFFHELEFWSVMFFTLEYVLRVWSLGAKHEDSAWRGRRGYIFSPFGLVDFFATMPYYMHVFFPSLDLRILRVLRLLRILKLSKYNSALQDLFSAVYSERRAFGSAAFLLLIATIVSASLMHFAEGHAQPEQFGTIPHSIYWAIVTITSGYGNIEPVTKGGELVALLTSLPSHMSFILIEHDLEIALRVVERVTVTHNGSVIKTGSPSEIENDQQVQAIYMGGKH